jgi:hypothetical protein
LNHIIRYGDNYYAYYHGTPTEDWSEWNTNIPVSPHLIHWKKNPGKSHSGRKQVKRHSCPCRQTVPLVHNARGGKRAFSRARTRQEPLTELTSSATELLTAASFTFFSTGKKIFRSSLSAFYSVWLKFCTPPVF